MSSHVVAVHRKSSHFFSKDEVPSIVLVAGRGVQDDAHFGETVKHRSRVAKDPTQPNLRQVHLIHEELLSEVGKAGLSVAPGKMGENITTAGIALLSLSTGTHLKIGANAIIEITGLRNPCSQIEKFKSGPLAAVLERHVNGSLIRKAGVMAVVLEGGVVCAGDAISVVHDPNEYKPLLPV